MSRNDLLVRLLATVGGIVAVGLTAATIRSPVETGGSGGVGSEGRPSQPSVVESTEGGGAPVFLEYLVYAILLLIAVALVWYLIAHRREFVRSVAVWLVLVLVAAAVLWLVTSVWDGNPGAFKPPMEPTGNETGTGGDGLGGDSGNDGTALSVGPLFGLLALITAVFVGGLLVSRGTDRSESTAADPDESPGSDRTVEDAAAVGAAAGRAADRLENATDADNEIYRAWRELTRLLEVDRPESSTPREFASAAIEAGIDREHVDELTRLFEDVRYGDTETTPEMEARAVSVLRRIEATHAETDSSSESDRAGGGE
ncbi:DUF4129 domain-containing protein [Halopiger djelfimassiliensis]|uniref:DUF4129 domain-containing protein n=1 Tax=Halopiger djelfimassiliensis TaxID=1293047 RepID=UPI000677AA16|nr:DUF4129 domain-containing protein [Halopiger djelfimassiliensis]